MRDALRSLKALAACAALTLVLGGGCSSEQSAMTLNVTATPNPVTGTDDNGQRRWDFEIAVANPNAVGVYVENFHVEITDTDTGYEVPLVIVKDPDIGIIGEYIAAGATASYAASRTSQGRFSSGRERRVYHALGDDGVYYSGEVEIVLQ